MKTKTTTNAVLLAIHKPQSQAEIDEYNKKQAETSKALTESVDEMMRLYFGIEENKKGA